VRQLKGSREADQSQRQRSVFDELEEIDLNFKLKILLRVLSFS